MSIDLSHLNRVQRWFYRKRRMWLELSVLSMVLLIMLEIYMFSAGFPTFIVNIAPILVAPLLGILVLSTFWRGSLSFAVVLMGVACIAGGMFVMPYALSHGIASQAQLTSYTTFTFTIGIGTLITSLIMVYRPNLLYAKNRPRVEQPPSTWKKDMAKGQRVIPLRKLLSENEIYILPNYNYVMVSINSVTYLVPPDEAVPEGSIVQRNNGYFIGFRKIYDGYFF
ncbi:MAG: hypothetical protein ACE5KA_00155 [Nitrososphaerales archaeon]